MTKPDRSGLMNALTFPKTIDTVDPTKWASFSGYFEELLERPLSSTSLPQWLSDWSTLGRIVQESISWTYIQKSLDTADEEREAQFLQIISEVYPELMKADHALKQRLLAVDSVSVENFELVLRNLQNESELFREENIPLVSKLQALSNEYDKVTGGMSLDWDGEEKNLSQLTVFLQDKDRAVRERAWRGMMSLWQAQRETLNDLYVQMLELREQVAENAGFDDYRAYVFRQRGRFDYTPEDCETFHNAIEAVVVPAAQRVYARRRAELGLDALKPWDQNVEPGDDAPLQPYEGQDELIQRSLNIFQQVDPELARYFATMAEENLLDLDTRQKKALGGYCSSLPLRKRPFIFMNGVGIHDDVQTLLHEAGHAFHDFESSKLPLLWQTESPMEFAEVASMSMELLAAPFLTKEHGGFYSEAEAARAQIEHLEGIITFLPYMAVVDAFQHWVYTHPNEAKTAANCDAQWAALWQRFMKGLDWSGFEEEMKSGWHRKLHIFQIPFYYIEYGMAQVGALQVWRNSMDDPQGALEAYRHALSLGGTKTLPQLFEAAGAQFRFDAPMLTELVTLIENRIEELG